MDNLAVVHKLQHAIVDSVQSIYLEFDAGVGLLDRAMLENSLAQLLWEHEDD